MKLWTAILILVYAVLSGLFGFDAFAAPFSVLVLGLLWASAFEAGGGSEERRLLLKQLKALEDIRRELFVTRQLYLAASQIRRRA